MKVKRTKLFWKSHQMFWSLYGRYAWDAQREPAMVSAPPHYIVEVIKNRRIDSFERLLDAGCGTGNYAIALAKAGFRVIGTDFADGMLAKAQEKISRDLSENVSFRRADLNYPLDFPQEYFDYVVSMSVMQAVADFYFTLSEFHRVLKPQGTIVLSLPKQDSKVLLQSISELIKYRIRHLERRTPGKMLWVVLKSFVDRFYPTFRWTAAQAEAMLSVSGFKVIRVEEERQILIVAEKCSRTAAA
ncbi:MAG: class I SAM-dependent methyltransferase [candidate division FCPU426 bacterium]